MEQETKEEKKQRILDYYNSQTPIFLITKSDQWISGYINEQPEELYFFVYDWKENEIIRILYSDLHVFKPYVGDYDRLPKPEYLALGNRLMPSLSSQEQQGSANDSEKTKNASLFQAQASAENAQKEKVNNQKNVINNKQVNNINMLGNSKQKGLNNKK